MIAGLEKVTKGRRFVAAITVNSSFELEPLGRYRLSVLFEDGTVESMYRVKVGQEEFDSETFSISQEYLSYLKKLIAEVTRVAEKPSFFSMSLDSVHETWVVVNPANRKHVTLKSWGWSIFTLDPEDAVNSLVEQLNQALRWQPQDRTHELEFLEESKRSLVQKVLDRLLG